MFHKVYQILHYSFIYCSYYYAIIFLEVMKNYETELEQRIFITKDSNLLLQ